MDLREVLGYLFLLVAIGSTAAGIWAAWYYSHARIYARRLDRERRALHRGRAAG